MKNRLVNSQLTNLLTYQMYLRQFLTLAENVFEFKGLPEFLDVAYINKVLLRQGSIAFFYDEELEELLALPYRNVGSLDVYGRPIKIQVYSKNGYTKILNKNEFVIMYDNYGQYPLYLDIIQYAERMAKIQRTEDINIDQQKTPRFWKTDSEHEKSVKDSVNNVDGFSEIVLTYKDIDLDDSTLVLAPAPYVTDKLDAHKEKIYGEFLRLIGISNVTYQKKERLISDEVEASQGGTVASRYSRLEPRLKAIKQINEKFKQYLNEEITVEYYDGIPSDKKEDEENVFEYDEN